MSLLDKDAKELLKQKKKEENRQRREEIGSYLRQLRKANGFTTEEVARKVGLSIKSINYYEFGQREMKLDVFEALCKIYQTTPDEVFQKSKRID